MKKKFIAPLTKFNFCSVLAFTMLFLFQSCKKEIFEAANQKPISEDLKWAADYYQQKLEPNKNLLVMPSKGIATEGTTSKNRTNKMVVLWELAYSAKTSLYQSVEVPVNIDGKIMPTFVVTKDPKAKPVLDLEIINASLNRVYIYRDKNGNINQNLITYVPDKEYLSKYNGNIKHNRVDKLDEDFFGYLQYKDWDGNVIFVLRIENGKIVRRIETSNSVLIDEAVKQNANLSFEDQKKTNNYQVATCDEWTIRYDWEQWCYYQGSSQTPTYCDPPEIYNAHITPNCPGGSGGGTTNPSSEIINNLTNSCLNSTYTAITNTGNINNKINTLIQGVFNVNDKVNLIYNQSTSLPNNRLGSTDAGYAGTDVNGNKIYNVTVSLNENVLPGYSKELTAVTILHEALHGYFEYKGVFTADGTAQHLLMATKYVDLLRLSVKSVYSNLEDKDANILILSEMADIYTQFPQTYNDLLAQYNITASQYNSIIPTYKSGSAGTRCGNQ